MPITDACTQPHPKPRKAPAGARLSGSGRDGDAASQEVSRSENIQNFQAEGMRSGVGVTDKGQADREVMRVVKGMSSISQLVEGGREME